MVPKRRYPSRQLYAAMAPRLVPGTTNTRPLSGGVSGPQFTAKLEGWVKYSMNIHRLVHRQGWLRNNTRIFNPLLSEISE